MSLLEAKHIINQIIQEKKIGFNRGPEYSEETEDLLNDFAKSTEMINKELSKKVIDNDDPKVQEILNILDDNLDSEFINDLETVYNLIQELPDKPTEKEKIGYIKEDLRKWFGRKGAKGKTGGWVDCNAPDGKGGYKPCGRKKGEKRKYPACRPTPAGCKDKGKGKKWGKKSGKSKKMKKEDLLKTIIREEISKIIMSEKKKKKGAKRDACYHKVRRRYKVWPSAYASGALSKCRKVGAANWGNKSKKK